MGQRVFHGIQNEKQSERSGYFLFSESPSGQLKLTIAHNWLKIYKFYCIIRTNGLDVRSFHTPLMVQVSPFLVHGWSDRYYC